MLIPGTCFSSRQGSERYQVRKAGEAGAVTITLMTESGNALDQNYISNELIARGKGVTFAIINDFVGLDAALTTQGQSVQQGRNRVLFNHLLFNCKLTLPRILCHCGNNKNEKWWHNDAQWTDFEFRQMHPNGCQRCGCWFQDGSGNFTWIL